MRWASSRSASRVISRRLSSSARIRNAAHVAISLRRGRSRSASLAVLRRCHPAVRRSVRRAYVRITSSTRLAAAPTSGIRHHARVTVTKSDFVAEVIAAVPETQPLLAERLRDQFGELLLHQFVADLRRFAIASFEQGESERMHALLAVMDKALREGDEDVENAVAVSFVEDTGWWEPAMRPFIATWPAGLKAEAERQRHWRA